MTRRPAPPSATSPPGPAGAPALAILEDRAALADGSNVENLREDAT